jgi:hypothetical protein
MYDLSARFVRSPLAAACMTLAAPALMVLSHTVMTDVAFLAFWLLALSRFLRVLDGSTRRCDWAVWTLSLLAAGFMTVLSAALLILMGTQLWLNRKSLPQDLPTRRIVLVLISPLVLWTAWFLLAYIHYGRFVLADTVGHMQHRSTLSWSLVAENSLSFVLNLGAVFVFPVAIWLGLARRDRLRVSLSLFVLSLVPFFTWVDGWSGPQALLFAAFLSSGILVLWEAFRVLWSSRRDVRCGQVGLNPDWRFLSFWFFGILLECLVLFYSGSVRYCLLSLPPVVLLWCRAMEEGEGRIRLRGVLIWGAVALTALFGVLVSYADYSFAATYREAAQGIVREYAKPGRTIWVAGEWGFRYYMNRAGGRTLLRHDTSPKEGDLIVKPYVAMPWVTLYDNERLVKLVEQRFPSRDSAIRVLDFLSHAGFYSTGWGILPVSLASESRWEWFNVYEVKQRYEGAAPEPEPPW